MSAQWPVSGGSGGVIGPGSSAVNAVAVYTDATGTKLSDGTITQQVLVPAGDGQDAVDGGGGTGPQLVGKAALAHAGLAGSTTMNAPGSTGWKIITLGAIDYLEMYVQGQNMMTYSGNRASGPRAVYTFNASGSIRSDSTAAIDIGGGPGLALTSAFRQLFIDTVIAGCKTPNTRGIYFSTAFTGNSSVTGNPFGIGLDSLTGKEFYLALYPAAGGAKYVQAFNIISNTVSKTTISAPDNTAGGNFPTSTTDAVSIALKGADSGGTGNAGNLLLGTSTSVSGTEGNPCMANTSGVPAAPTVVTGFSPFRFDPATNKLYIHNGTAWKSVTLV